MRAFYSLLLGGLLAGGLWLTSASSVDAAPPTGVAAANDQDVQLAQWGRGWGRGWGNWGGYYAPRFYGPYYNPRYYGSYNYPYNYGSYYYPRSSYYGNYYTPSYSNCYYDYNTGSYVCYSPYHGWYQAY